MIIVIIIHMKTKQTKITRLQIQIYIYTYYQKLIMNTHSSEKVEFERLYNIWIFL